MIQNLDGRRAWVELHIIVAVVDGRVPLVIVEVERGGDRFQGLVN